MWRNSWSYRLSSSTCGRILDWTVSDGRSSFSCDSKILFIKISISDLILRLISRPSFIDWSSNLSFFLCVIQIIQHFRKFTLWIWTRRSTSVHLWTDSTSFSLLPCPLSNRTLLPLSPRICVTILSSTLTWTAVHHDNSPVFSTCREKILYECWKSSVWNVAKYRVFPSCVECIHIFRTVTGSHQHRVRCIQIQSSRSPQYQVADLWRGGDQKRTEELKVILKQRSHRGSRLPARLLLPAVFSTTKC